LLVDANGERLTPSHAVKKGRRYRYYISAALITEAGTDRAQGWRLAAREIEDAVIRILVDALTAQRGCSNGAVQPTCLATKFANYSVAPVASRRHSAARPRNERRLFERSSR